jgi:F0F1-type ATP synthase gamma subunit
MQLRPSSYSRLVNKGRDFFRNRNAVIVEEYVALTGKGRVDYSEALEVAQSIIKLYTEDEGIDKVFRSTMSSSRSFNSASFLNNSYLSPGRKKKNPKRSRNRQCL